MTPQTTRSYEDAQGNSWTFGFRWEVIRGRYEPVELTVTTHGQPITATGLRGLPLGEIFSEARIAQMETATQTERPPDAVEDRIQYVHDAITDLEQRMSERIAELRARNEAWGPHRGKATTPEELEHVVLAYRTARAYGRPVTEAVAEALDVSPSTAGKRIMAARLMLDMRGEEL